VLQQGSTQVPLYSLPGSDPAALAHEGKDQLRLVRQIGKRQVPQLAAGKARILVTAVRPVLFGYRQVQTTAERDVDVRLNPPIVSVVSTFHYINQGGSELVVYRVSPSDASSGVRVGDQEYPGYPASGAHIPNADPGLRVAFFALLWNQNPSTPITLYARDDVGNESRASFDYRVFPKSFRQSRIPIDDHFLEKVVPPILANSPELHVANPQDLLRSFLTINNDLRRENNATITALGRSSAAELLWQGPFKQLVNTAVEAGFADQRAYVYKGEVVDHQVHLGFDLASVTNAPVLAANRGRIVHAGWLGIYGNCVIIDHGMGLQSLYGHMSSIEVKVGDMVNEGTRLGRSGSTGLAGGDHLHFTMLLAGNAVTPIDWWSGQWVQDRIMRKIHDTGGLAASTPNATAAVRR
jgi:murein DD-endopeptidase MepM/ murein hydrolase activator NlpD